MKTLLTILLLTHWLPVQVVNWADYSYQPEVKVKVRCSNDSLFLDWKVKENNVRATVTKDRGNVWEDSCVEFFVMMPDGEHYSNFECTCLGYLLSDIQLGMFPRGRTHRSEEELKQVTRRSSLGHDSIGIIPGKTTWRLHESIPLRWILSEENWNEKGRLRKGTSIRCNFYKCADKSPNPHYLSWMPIHTEQPNFHRPQDFVLLRLK